VLEPPWQHLGVDQVIGEVLGRRRFGFDVERALFAMVGNRALAPYSKLCPGNSPALHFSRSWRRGVAKVGAWTTHQPLVACMTLCLSRASH